MNKEKSISSKLRIKSILWPALTGVLLILQLIWPGKAWAVLLTIFGGGWIIAYIWSISLAHSLRAERGVQYGWVKLGDQLEEQFSIINSSWLPALWVELDDQSDLPNYTASRLASVDGESFTQWQTHGVCKTRGLFTLGPATMTYGDPLGVYKVVQPITSLSYLLVLPPVFSLPSIEVASGGRVGEGRQHRRSAMEATVSAHTVREFVEGDPLRSIHWPTSARRNKLYVRQFEQRPSGDWWICLDMNKAVQRGEEDRSTEEYGVVLAASLANKGLKMGHPVGLVSGGQELVWIPPRRISGQMTDILRSLAMVKKGNLAIDKILDKVRPSMYSGASLIIITPDVSYDWTGPLLKLIKVGVTPTIVLLDPLSFGGEEDATGISEWLVSQRIAYTIVKPDFLDLSFENTQDNEWESHVPSLNKTLPGKRFEQTGRSETP